MAPFVGENVGLSNSLILSAVAGTYDHLRLNYLVRQGTEKLSLKCFRKGTREVALSAKCLLCRTCGSEFESQTPMQEAGHSGI